MINVKQNCLLAFLIGSSSFCFSQEKDPSIIASAGGSSTTTSYSLDWTMGEYAVETIMLPGNMYTQGFQQPLQIVSMALKPESSITYNVSIAPNPVVSILNFSINSANDVPVSVIISDMYGRAIIQKSVRSSRENLPINMRGLLSGTYFLTVREGSSSKIIKSYKIIKQNN